MEAIQGKRSLDLNLHGLKERLTDHSYIALDLGTGDGRYARTLARLHPDRFVIGVDACRENLRETSRADLTNLLFIIACAQQLPSEFHGLFSQVTINFPWGSLLEDLLAGKASLMEGLLWVSRPRAHITLHLNSGELLEAGIQLEHGVERIRDNLKEYGWDFKTPCPLDKSALAGIPSTWAKRLAHGRDPRAFCLTGRRSSP